MFSYYRMYIQNVYTGYRIYMQLELGLSVCSLTTECVLCTQMETMIIWISTRIRSVRTHRHTQTHTDTHRHTQTRTDTHTPRHRLMFLDHCVTCLLKEFTNWYLWVLFNYLSWAFLNVFSGACSRNSRTDACICASCNCMDVCVWMYAYIQADVDTKHWPKDLTNGLLLMCVMIAS